MWRITVQQKSVKVHFYVHLMSIFMNHKISFPIFSTMRPIWNFSVRRIISNLAIFTGTTQVPYEWYLTGTVRVGRSVSWCPLRPDFELNVILVWPSKFSSSSTKKSQNLAKIERLLGLIIPDLSVATKRKAGNDLPKTSFCRIIQEIKCISRIPQTRNDLLWEEPSALIWLCRQSRP